MLFDKLSPTTDFISKTTIKLDILMKNVLYLTHEVDQIKKVVQTILNSEKLQTQVDEYFDEKDKDIKHIPEKESN